MKTKLKKLHALLDMKDAIKKAILLFALLSYFGSAFGMMDFSSNVTDVHNSKPCVNHIDSTSSDANYSDITPCDKHCASTTLVFSDTLSLVVQELASEVQDRLTINFNSLDTSINLPPPK